MECHRKYVLLLLQVILFVENCFAENLILNINFKKPIAVTSDAFLSFTLDPETLLHNIDDFTKNIERSINMARGLAPAYVRFAGPQSNFFEQTDLNNVTTNRGSISEIQWAMIYQWAENAGLDVIACIAPRFIENGSKTHSRDPTNIAEFLSFNDQMGYNFSWQLGYECQTRCKFSGEDLGRRVRNLRNLLETYPRYSNSLIIGPDIVTYTTLQQQRYLQDYFNSADDALSAITWHPNFANISLNDNNSSVIFPHHDNLAAELDEIYKIIGHTARNKPLWIAESAPEKYKYQHLGALIWTRRLGNAAKLGIQVVMRQRNLSKATPDYWVSLLHKTLVGRNVLETRIQYSDNDNVHFYSQCTKPSAFYDKGTITIFGVNLTPETITANLKEFNIKTLHKYILSPDFETDDKMFSEKTLLNNKPLNLIDDQKLPNLHPEIITDSDNLELELPSGNIGFWVLPDAKIKACMYSEEETIVNATVKILSKRHEDTIQQNNPDSKKKDVSQSDLQNQKTYKKQSRRRQKNLENEDQNIWNSKLFNRIERFLQKKLLQNKKNKDSSNVKNSDTIALTEDQLDPSEEKEEQSNLNNFETADDNPEDIHDTLKSNSRALKKKRLKRDLNKISENSEAKILDKRSQINDLKNHSIMRKIKQIISKKKPISDDSNKSNHQDLLRRKLTKRFLENEAAAVRHDHHSTRQKFKREFIRNKNNINKEYSKIDDVDDYQSPIQRLERMKREMGKKLAEINSRKEHVFRKRSNDVKDYANERKIKKRDNLKKEGLLTPFNPRTENGENDFYGFFRRNPINNFPKGDIFVTAGDSVERNREDYDYVGDENDNIDDLKQKNVQHEQMLKKTMDYPLKNTWEEPQIENNHMPNEFFENVKLSDKLIKKGSKDYEDLWEAQHFSEERENEDANIRTENTVNNRKSIAEILAVRSNQQPDEVEEKHRETSTQYDQNVKYESLKSRLSTTFNQLAKIPAYTDYHHISNVRPEETQLKINSQSKVSFYQPAQLSAARYNYDNYQTSTAKYTEAKLSDKEDSIMNVSIDDGVPQKRGRAKRSDWDKLEMDLAQEMFEQDENNAKDCHCRVIRDSPKKFCSCRAKRDNQASESSLENVNIDSTIFARNVRNLMTKEDYEKIMTGEILPSTSNSEYDEHNTIANSIVAKLNEVNYGANDAMQMTDATPTLSMDSSTINISEQSDNVEKSTTESLLMDSTLGLSLSNNDNTVEEIRNEFFRTQSPNIQTENEATTYDFPQIDYRVYSNNRKDLLSSSITKSSQNATREKKETVVNMEEEIENSAHSTIATNQEDEERQEDNYISDLKTTISSEEITEAIDIAKDTTTEEMCPSERIMNELIDNSKSNETETRSQRNVKDNSKNKFEDEEGNLKLNKDTDTRRIKNTMENLPKTPLRTLARIEENLMKRAEQIEKQKERLYVKREKLLQQYHQELVQIADEQKRNLKRRQAWERFCGSDDFHHMINGTKFLGILIDDNISCEEDNDDEEYNDEEEYDRRYVIPIELIFKQCDALLNQIYPKIIYKYNRPQLLRLLVKDEQESTESISKADHRIFVIDPSTYYGGEPILQLYKDYLNPSKYYSHVKSQIQTPKWTLKDYQVYSKKFDKEQYPVTKLQEYMKKSPIQNYPDREKADALYVLDAQKQSDLAKELAEVWLSTFNRRNEFNRITCNEMQDESSNTPLEEKHDDSMSVTDEETELTRDFDTEINAENKKFIDFNNEKEDISNFRTSEENTEDITKNEEFENIKLTKDMKTEEDMENEQLVDIDNKKQDILNIGTANNLKDIDKNKETENTKEMLTNRYRKTTTKKNKTNLNKKNKNIIRDEAVEDVEKVTDVDSESNEFEKKITRTRRNIEKLTNNRYLEQLPYYLNNARNRPNRNIHVYLEKNSAKIFNDQPIQHIFQRKMLDSIDDDDSSEDFQILVELSRFLTKKVTDPINEYSDDESSEENYEFLLFPSNLLNKNIKNISYKKISSENKQDISEDDKNIRISYESRKEDNQYGSKSKESDKYSETKDKIQSYYNPIQFHKRRMLLLFPQKEKKEKRQRRQIENEINENINQIKHEPRQSILVQYPKDSAEYHLNGNNINKEERENIMKMESIRTNYLRPEMEKKSHDNLLEDFIESKKNHLHNNEISYSMKNKGKDKNSEDYILKSNRKLSLLEEPIPIVENLITRSDEKDATKSVEQFVNDFEQKYKETFILDEDKHSKEEISEINNNDLNTGFIQKLFTFFSKIPRIFM